MTSLNLRLLPCSALLHLDNHISSLFLSPQWSLEVPRRICGGELISDGFEPSVRIRRVTSDYIWPDLRKRGSYRLKKKRMGDWELLEFLDDEDFEADFQHFLWPHLSVMGCRDSFSESLELMEMKVPVGSTAIRGESV